MQDHLKKKQKIRFDFLKKLYELSDGDTNKYVNPAVIAQGIGIDDVDELRIVVNYLENEHLIEAIKLHWGPASVRLTHYGLQEVEDAVSQPDKPTEHFPPVNILYVNQMIGSAIQQGTVGSTQSVSVDIKSLAEISRFILEVEERLEELGLDGQGKDEAQAEIHTIKAQVHSPKPKPSIIKECLESLRRILEGAAGSTIGSQLAAQIPALLVLLSKA